MDHIKTKIIKIAEFLFEYQNLKVTMIQRDKRYIVFVTRTDTNNHLLKDIENGWGYTEQSALENLLKTLSESLTTRLERAEEDIEYLENEKSRLYKMVEHIKALTEETEKTQ